MRRRVFLLFLTDTLTLNNVNKMGSTKIVSDVQNRKWKFQERIGNIRLTITSATGVN
jgi:hypothetical protein